MDESPRSQREAVVPARKPGEAGSQVIRLRAGAGARGIGARRERPAPGDGSAVSLVSRRYAAERRRRRRWLLAFVAAVVAVAGFGVPLALYLVAWLVWRNRPAHKSMRRVRQAIRALERGQTGVAFQRLQEAHFLDPSNNDALYRLGLLLAEQRRYSEAIEALSLVNERVPGLPEVEQALLEASVETADHEQAVYYAQRILERDPYDLQVLVRLADAFEALGQANLAIRVLEQTPHYRRTLDDGMKQVLYRLAALYERRGDYARAREHYERLAAGDASFRDVRDRLLGLPEAGP